MRKLLVLGAVLAAVVLPSASQAQVSLGLRLGYGIGMGDVGGTLGMSDWVKGQIPLQIDAMYRATPEIGVGVYLSRGLGVLNSDISDACSDCSGAITRLGLQATYTLTTVSPTVVPWLGAGFGYEWNTLDDGFDTLTFSGWEYLNLQVGGDFKVNQQFVVGPYAQFAIGQYDSAELSGTSADITDTSMHQWLSFGVRGKFDF